MEKTKGDILKLQQGILMMVTWPLVSAGIVALVPFLLSKMGI